MPHAPNAIDHLPRIALAIALCLALGGCELLFQWQFLDAWACQGKDERCE